MLNKPSVEAFSAYVAQVDLGHGQSTAMFERVTNLQSASQAFRGGGRKRLAQSNEINRTSRSPSSVGRYSRRGERHGLSASSNPSSTKRCAARPGPFHNQLLVQFVHCSILGPPAFRPRSAIAGYVPTTYARFATGQQLFRKLCRLHDQRNPITLAHDRPPSQETTPAETTHPSSDQVGRTTSLNIDTLLF